MKLREIKSPSPFVKVFPMLGILPDVDLSVEKKSAV
jgi:hypothetical protein